MQNSIVRRAQSKTPKFFRKVRTIGLSVAAIGATLLTAPVALPAIVIKLAGYLAVAGTVMSGVSQVTVKEEKE